MSIGLYSTIVTFQVLIDPSFFDVKSVPSSTQKASLSCCSCGLVSSTQFLLFSPDRPVLGGRQQSDAVGEPEVGWQPHPSWAGLARSLVFQTMISLSSEDAAIFFPSGEYDTAAAVKIPLIVPFSAPSFE
jgi:hypothetical protein